MIKIVHTVQQKREEDEQVEDIKIKAEPISAFYPDEKPKNGKLAWGQSLNCGDFVGLSWTRDIPESMWARVAEVSHAAARQRRTCPRSSRKRLSSTVMELPLPAPVSCKSDTPCEEAPPMPLNGTFSSLLLSKLQTVYRNDSGDSDDAAQEVSRYLVGHNERSETASPLMPPVNFNSVLHRDSPLTTQAFATNAELTTDERACESRVTTPEGGEAGMVMETETKSNDGEEGAPAARIKVKRGRAGRKKRKRDDVDWVQVLESHVSA